MCAPSISSRTIETDSTLIPMGTPVVEVALDGGGGVNLDGLQTLGDSGRGQETAEVCVVECIQSVYTRRGRGHYVGAMESYGKSQQYTLCTTDLSRHPPRPA